MKTAAKIFLIITIVSMALTCLGGLVCTVMGIVFFNVPIEPGNVTINGEAITDPDIVGLIFGTVFTISGASCIVFGVIGLIISVIGLKKLNNAQKASDISTGWKVVILLFSNLISGILLLCMKDEDYGTKAVAPQDNNDDLEQIAKLKKLLDMGAITPEEYEYKKTKIFEDSQPSSEQSFRF